MGATQTADRDQQLPVNGRSLPVEKLRELLALAGEGDVLALRGKLRELSEKNSDCTGFAQQLVELASAYRIEELEILLGQAISETAKAAPDPGALQSASESATSPEPGALQCVSESVTAPEPGALQSASESATSPEPGALQSASESATAPEPGALQSASESTTAPEQGALQSASESATAPNPSALQSK